MNEWIDNRMDIWMYESLLTEDNDWFKLSMVERSMNERMNDGINK